MIPKGREEAIAFMAISGRETVARHDEGEEDDPWLWIDGAGGLIADVLHAGVAMVPGQADEMVAEIIKRALLHYSADRLEVAREIDAGYDDGMILGGLSGDSREQLEAALGEYLEMLEIVCLCRSTRHR